MARDFTIDAQGNLHDRRSGRFAEKANSAPAGTLDRELISKARTEMMKVSLAVSRSYRLDPGDAEDAVQSVLVDVLSSKVRPPEEALAQPKLLKAMLRNHLAQYTVGYRHGHRHETFVARRALHQAIAEYEQKHGRQLSQREIDELAEKIRLSMPPKRRPSAGYHREVTTLSYSSYSEEAADKLALGREDQEPKVYDKQTDEITLQLHRLEAGGLESRVDVRRDSWRLFTIRTGAPQVAKDSLSWHQAKKAREFFETSRRNVHGVAVRFIDREATKQEEDALFAPFGPNLTQDQKVRIAETFESYPEYAGHLWREALKVATRR